MDGSEVEVIPITNNPMIIHSSQVSMPSQKSISLPYPNCERNIDRMFFLTGIPVIRSQVRAVRWIFPAFFNSILVGAWFCPLYYPEYYPTQGLVWTSDIVLITFVYNYLLYLQTKWDTTSCFEHTEVPNLVNRISLTFYVLYIIYWFYFLVIQFNQHPGPALIQLGNTLMSTAWFIFFSTAAVVYYYICIKLSQRAESLREWLRGLKGRHHDLDGFYLEYNSHYKKAKALAQHWNVIIFTGFLLLTFHVPIDFISVVYLKYYFDAFGLVIKILSLGWYTWRICDLNGLETHLIATLYKHRIFPVQQIKDIEDYAIYRPLGLNFYGLKINTAFLVKIALVIANIIIPTLYALISNHVFS
jgi:hypothetical protein